MWGVCFVVCLSGCESTSSPTLLLEYARSGGFAGESTELRLFEDGRADIVEDGERRDAELRTGTLEDLTELADQAGFGSLRERYLSRGAADVFRYEIKYGSSSVIADDPSLPRSLVPLIDCLDRVVAAEPRDDDGVLPPFDCRSRDDAGAAGAVARG